MLYKSVQSEMFTLDGMHTNSITVSLPLGFLIGVGFQNSGNATEFFSSQAFVKEGCSQGYIQLINNSMTKTNYWIWAVYALLESSAAEPSVTFTPGQATALAE